MVGLNSKTMLNLSTLNPKHKEIVIGCSLESLLYCYFKCLPFLYSQKLSPHRFDFFEEGVDLSQFEINWEFKDREYPTFPRSSKIPKALLFNQLFFLLYYIRLYK